jgi:hypothetical protein
LRAISDYRNYAHGKSTTMMAGSPVRAASQAARAARGVVSHASWWLRYHLHGQTHPTPPDSRRRRPGSRGSAE